MLLKDIIYKLEKFASIKKGKVVVFPWWIQFFYYYIRQMNNLLILGLGHILHLDIIGNFW